MTVSEQALVEAMARASYDEGAYCGNCGYEGWDTCLDCSMANYGYARKSLAALRAALGPDTVLTDKGVARVVVTGATWCEPHANDCSFHRFDGCDRHDLYTLTLENET